MYDNAKRLGYSAKPTVILKTEFAKLDDNQVMNRWTDRREQLVNGELEYSRRGRSLKGHAIYFGTKNISGYQYEDMTLVKSALADDNVILNDIDFVEKVRTTASDSGIDLKSEPFAFWKNMHENLYDVVAQEIGIDGWYSDTRDI